MGRPGMEGTAETAILAGSFESAGSADAGAPADAGEAAVLAEHRAALAKMRASLAVDMLVEASGARDTEIVRRLLDADTAALAASAGADGVPDIRALKEKLLRLKRDCGYLFAGGGRMGSGSGNMGGVCGDAGVFAGGGTTGSGTASGVSVLPGGGVDEDALSDDEYYRRKRH